MCYFTTNPRPLGMHQYGKHLDHPQPLTFVVPNPQNCPNKLLDLHTNAHANAVSHKLEPKWVSAKMGPWGSTRGKLLNLFKIGSPLE